MYHSITFTNQLGEEINTWDDWHLVSEERPSFQPPEERTSFITIPGSNGSLDISEALTGYPLYSRRKGSFEFIVVNDYGSWETRYKEMSNFLHNKKMKAILEDDPTYYYEGRFYLTEWKSGKGDWSTIKVEYEVAPFKKAVLGSDDPWRWDPFSFEDGVITKTLFGDLEVTSNTNWTKYSYTRNDYGDEPICPTFSVFTNSGNAMSVRYVNSNLNIDQTYTMTNGNNYIPEIVLAVGNVDLYFKGVGKVSILFHRGSL